MCGGYSIAYEPHPQVTNSSTRIGGAVGEWRFSFGARIAASGAVQDVVAGSPAAVAGLVPGMILVAVDDRRYSAAALTAVVEGAASSAAPIALLVNDRQTFETKIVHYTGGARLPALVRSPRVSALIDDITRSRVASRR